MLGIGMVYHSQLSMTKTTFKIWHAITLTCLLYHSFHHSVLGQYGTRICRVNSLKTTKQQQQKQQQQKKQQQQQKACYRAL